MSALPNLHGQKKTFLSHAFLGDLAIIIWVAIIEACIHLIGWSSHKKRYIAGQTVTGLLFHIFPLNFAHYSVSMIRIAIAELCLWLLAIVNCGYWNYLVCSHPSKCNVICPAEKVNVDALWGAMVLSPGAVPHRVLTLDPQLIHPQTAFQSRPLQPTMCCTSHHIFVFVLSALQLPLGIQKCAACMQWRHGILLHHNIGLETLTLEYVY